MAFGTTELHLAIQAPIKSRVNEENKVETRMLNITSLEVLMLLLHQLGVVVIVVYLSSCVGTRHRMVGWYAREGESHESVRPQPVSLASFGLEGTRELLSVARLDREIQSRMTGFSVMR